ncbi:MAG: hypothetical protein K8T25_09150 [Planctomycetia bacterium]|nr:hypothetical protein [Planctomycetia bacterium]
MSYNTESVWPRRWIVAMVIVLAVSSVITKLMFSWRYGDPPVALGSLYLGMVVAQVALLSYWFVLGDSNWLLKSAVTASGLTVTWAVSTCEFWSRWIPRHLEALPVTASMVFLPALSMALSVGVVRKYRARLIRIDPGDPLLADVWQFGIRHLMIATAVAAVLMTIAKGMRHFYQIHMGETFDISMFAVVLAMGYSLIAVVLVSACLGVARVWPRLFLVMLVATGVALWPLLVVPLNKLGATLYVAATLLGTLIAMVSLLVVRGGGYRLISLKQWPGVGAANDFVTATMADELAEKPANVLPVD